MFPLEMNKVDSALVLKIKSPCAEQLKYFLIRIQFLIERLPHISMEISFPGMRLLTECLRSLGKPVPFEMERRCGKIS
jgi:hypothetical protein